MSLLSDHRGHRNIEINIRSFAAPALADGKKVQLSCCQALSHSTMKNIPVLRLSFSVILLLFVFACGPRRPTNEKRYPVKGKVIAVNKAERTATIKHEDI